MLVRTVVLGALLSAPGLLASGGRLESWNASPEFVLLSSEAERKAWKGVTSEADAERFVLLFWAKRDPDPKASVNAFRTEFEKRVKEADGLFGLPRTRGALTERGKLYVLAGPPKSLTRVRGTKTQPMAKVGGTGSLEVPPPNEPGTSLGEHVAVFTYESGQLPPWAGVSSLTARFIVEETRDSVGGQNAGTVQQIMTTARSATLRNPDLTEPPARRTPEPDGTKGSAGSATIRTELERAIAREDGGPLTVVPFLRKDGTATLHVQLFVPPAGGRVPADATLGLLVRKATGGDAARFEGPVQLSTSDLGSFASHALDLPEGDFQVAAGLFDAGGKALVSGRRTVTVPFAPKELALGPILLASGFGKATDARPGDPFTFSGFRFLSKGGRLDATDGLAFVVRVYNPTVDPKTKEVRLARSVKIKPPGEPAFDVPQPLDAPIPVPDVPEKERPKLLGIDLASSLVDSDIGAYFKKPGPHELLLTVGDLVSGKAVHATAVFTIERAPVAKE